MLRYLTFYTKIIYLDQVLAHFRFQSESKTVKCQTSDNLFLEEQVKSIQKIKKLNRFYMIHDYCDLFLREKVWIKKVNYIRSNKMLPDWRKKIKIAYLIFKDPKIRLSRFTLGAIIKNN
jgi:hypothetical protein